MQCISNQRSRKRRDGSEGRDLRRKEGGKRCNGDREEGWIGIGREGKAWGEGDGKGNAVLRCRGIAGWLRDK